MGKQRMKMDVLDARLHAWVDSICGHGHDFSRGSGFSLSGSHSVSAHRKTTPATKPRAKKEKAEAMLIAPIIPYLKPITRPRKSPITSASKMVITLTI